MMSHRRALLALCCCCVVFDAHAAPRTRSGRDWSSMTEEDWQRIEKEWETPEEEEEYAYKPPQQKPIDMDKLKGLKGEKLQEAVADSQVKSGPTMMFATVDYPDCCDKKKTEEIATRWAQMLRAGGMDIQTYVIEDDQVLFSSQAGLHAGEIKAYALKQPECVAVEWNQRRTPGPAETPEWKARDAQRKAEKDAEKAAKKAEEAAVEKAAKKAE